MSNHGARQLDTTPATIEVLTEIVKVVGNQAEVYLDGGVMRGTDVLKVSVVEIFVILIETAGWCLFGCTVSISPC